MQARLDRMAAMLEGAPGQYSISSQYAPTKDDTFALEARRREILAALMPGDHRETASLISAMMLGFGGGAKTELEAKKTISLYVSQLNGFPQWAIKAACETAMRSGSDFAPSVANLSAKCQEQIAPWQIELANINKVLGAKVARPVDPDERNRVSIGFRNLRDELRAISSDDRAKAYRPSTRDEAADWLKAHEGGKGLESVMQFSDALISQLRGEKPIGQGKLGCLRLPVESHADDFEVGQAKAEAPSGRLAGATC